MSARLSHIWEKFCGTRESTSLAKNKTIRAVGNSGCIKASREGKKVISDGRG